MSEDLGTVKDLWRYPVKSALGSTLTAAEITWTGVVGDRRYLIRACDDGRIITAKAAEGVPLLRCMTEEAMFGPLIKIPRVRTLPLFSPEAQQELSKLLGFEVEVVPVDQTAPATNFGFTLRPGMGADSSPLHLVYQSTFDELANALSNGTYDARRFRPSVVLETTEPGFSEKLLVGRRLKLGADVEIFVRKVTERCPLPARAQLDLDADTQLLRYLKLRHNLCLGVYAVVTSPGIVCYGDPVVVV